LTDPRGASVETKHRYESPDRGTLTDDQWDALFAFVKGGGGFFALHTASACWDHKVEDPTDARSVEFHVGMLNAEFGGHSPYKDYVSHVVSPGGTDPITGGLSDYVVSDELYHPIVYNKSRSEIFLTAYDPGQCGPTCDNATAIHGLRHSYGQGRVLYFAQGHDMAEYETPEMWEGNHAFGTIISRSLMWLAQRT
jgi:type 1 glutamine amidotransferase